MKKICIMVEGSYPYVQGGVSSWVNALITQLPEFEFVIQTIAATRKEKGKFRYTLPENITAVHESFLQDDDLVTRAKIKKTLTKREKQALKSLVFGADEEWEVLFEAFTQTNLSLNALLMGMDFYDVVEEFYNERYDRVVFTDFLWTCRSMFLPLFTLMKWMPPEADVYHSMSTGYSGIIASCASHLYQSPLLLTEHGIYTREREEEIIRSAWTQGIYKDLWINHFYMLSRCTYTRASRVFSLFDRARELQVEYGCPEGKTEVVHNGVKYDQFQNLERKSPDDKYVNIGAVLRVTPIKDVKTMISAFHFAKEKMENLRLYIIGNTDEDQDYYEECVEMIATLGTRDIIFTGHVNVRDYLGKMDIVLLTSISEGQPLSVLEAMAARIPCITTNVGDCFDMLSAGDFENRAGIVAPVMNIGKLAGAILTLAEDEALRQRLGENGRSIVDRYYRDTVFIDRYRKAYEHYGTPGVGLSEGGEPHGGHRV